MKTVDIIIIGAGTAGLSARKEVAKVTQNYLVIDHGPLGTTCSRVGCMPSKVLIQIANHYHVSRRYDEMGICGASQLRINAKAVLADVRRLRDRFVRSVLKDMQEWQDEHLLQGHVKFLDSQTLQVNEQTLRAGRIILATGSRPVMPANWLALKKHLITSENLFDLEELPQNMAVIGLGAIGLEIGQALSRLGVQIEGFDIQKKLGILTDPLLLEYSIKVMSQEFPMHFTGAEPLSETPKGVLLKSGDQTMEFNKVFLAMGRTPNLQSLDIEKTGIKLGKRGIPEYDPETLRIKNAPMYLIGDVNGDRPILHEAADQGRIAGFNSVRSEDVCFKRKVPFGIVFTEPNLCLVGKNYEELTRENIKFVSGNVSFEGQGRAIILRQEKGLIHVYAENPSGRILGAEIFCPGGEHMAHALNWMITKNQTVFEVLSNPYYHPSLEEGLRTALRRAARSLNPTLSALDVLRCEDLPLGF